MDKVRGICLVSLTVFMCAYLINEILMRRKISEIHQDLHEKQTEILNKEYGFLKPDLKPVADPVTIKPDL